MPIPSKKGKFIPFRVEPSGEDIEDLRQFQKKKKETIIEKKTILFCVFDFLINNEVYKRHYYVFNKEAAA